MDKKGKMQLPKTARRSQSSYQPPALTPSFLLLSLALSLLSLQQHKGRGPFLLEEIWVQRKKGGFPRAPHQSNYK